MNDKKKIKAQAFTLEVDGKKSTYRLTKTRPSMILYFEHKDVYSDQGTTKCEQRKAAAFLDAAFAHMEEIAPEHKRAILSDYGLVEVEQQAAPVEWLEGVGIMPRVKNNRIVCPTCQRVTEQRVTPDAEADNWPFVCPYCNTGHYISFIGENVEVPEP